MVHADGGARVRECCAKSRPVSFPGSPPGAGSPRPTFDLFVWLSDEGTPSGFQLCYDKQSREHALTWTPAAGYTHMAVDGGESRPGRYKGTPILVANGSIDVEGILAQLRSQAEAVPPDFLRFIEGKIGGWVSSSSPA